MVTSTRERLTEPDAGFAKHRLFPLIQDVKVATPINVPRATLKRARARVKAPAGATLSLLLSLVPPGLASVHSSRRTLNQPPWPPMKTLTFCYYRWNSTDSS